MSNSLIKTIETDIFQKLESPSNDFLANTAGLIVDKIICDDFIILANGNQVHNFTCQYHISGEFFQAKRIQLIMRDNVIDLESAINAALVVLQDGSFQVDELQRYDAILDNGNKYYCCCIIYEPDEIYPVGPLKVRIIEKDNLIDMQNAVNAFLLLVDVLSALGVLRQEFILANGNKIYICTIPYYSLLD